MNRRLRYVLVGAIPGAIGGALKGWEGFAVGTAIGMISGAIGSVVNVPQCPPRKPVMLIGDSLAVGLAPRLSDLAIGCGIDFTSYTEGATGAPAWTGRRWNEALAVLGGKSMQGGVVLISLGGNDYRRTDPKRVDAAIGTILANVRKLGATPRWIAPPKMPWADSVGAVNMWKRWLGARRWSYYPTSEMSYPVSPDRIHPTLRGYDELAHGIWNWLAIVES